MDRQTTRLTGKGGVGLVMFHLARRGLEFTPTTESSDGGDLWVRTGAGIVSVEVKASWNESWSIRRGQLERSQFVCFVCMSWGRCWVLPVADVLALVTGQRGDKLHVVTKARLQTTSEDAWHLLTGDDPKRSPVLVPRPRRARRGAAVYTRPRTVRVRLADGTVKEYRYGYSENEMENTAAFSETT